MLMLVVVLRLIHIEIQRVQVALCSSCFKALKTALSLLSCFFIRCLSEWVLWILDQNILVYQIVVVVVEAHNASRERMINIANDLNRLALVILFARDRHRFFYQMRRLHHSVRMQLPIALDVADAVIILVDVGVGAEVGITWTFAYRVADLLA